MIKHPHKIIFKCRLCKSRDLIYVYRYNKSPLCDEFLEKKKKQFFYPLNLQKCNKCNFVQIDTVVEPRKIYDNYLYLSKSSSGLSEHFRDYSKQILKKLKIRNQKKIIDIGSNDGVLLKHFKKAGHKVYGIEPFKEASIVANKNNILTINSYFDKDLVKSFKKILGQVDLICINNLFANVEDLDDFTLNCNEILKDDGYIVIESSYLFDMLKKNIFDFVYHEHLSYLSINPLRKYFKKFGLTLIDLHASKSKGGSLRYIFKKSSKKQILSDKVKKLINRETIDYKNFDKIIYNFKKNISELKNNLHSFLRANHGKTIAAFGASATSTTFLTENEIGTNLSYFIDENPSKIHKYSPGYSIKVIKLNNIKKYKIDIIIILAWRFAPQIAKKIKKHNTNYLVPLPKFKYYEF